MNIRCHAGTDQNVGGVHCGYENLRCKIGMLGYPLVSMIGSFEPLATASALPLQSSIRAPIAGLRVCVYSSPPASDGLGKAAKYLVLTLTGHEDDYGLMPIGGPVCVEIRERL